MKKCKLFLILLLGFILSASIPPTMSEIAKAEGNDCSEEKINEKIEQLKKEKLTGEDINFTYYHSAFHCAFTDKYGNLIWAIFLQEDPGEFFDFGWDSQNFKNAKLGITIKQELEECPYLYIIRADIRKIPKTEKEFTIHFSYLDWDSQTTLKIQIKKP